MNPAAATRGFQLHWPSVAVTLAASAFAGLSWKGITRWWASRNRAEARAKVNAGAASAAAAPSASSASSASAASASVSPAQSASLLDFLLIVGKCKVEKRTGWVNDEVPLPESVADHMFRMSVMAMCCANYASLGTDAAKAICPARAMRMALVHDLAESLVGDITPTQFSGVSKADKSKQESQAMHTIANKLAEAHGSAPASSTAASAYTGIAAEVLSLWLEYESGATPTALFVKSCDKLEMYVQAYEYQQAAAASQAAAANSGDDEAEMTAQLLQVRLDRFYQSMEDTRLKALAQDAANGSAAQQLLVGVISELQRRIVGEAAVDVAEDESPAAPAVAASTTDSFVFVAGEDGFSMEEKRAMQYAHDK